MIVYKPNKHFLSDIGHLSKSWTMVKIVRSVLAIGAYTMLVCAPVLYFEWTDDLVMDTSVYSFLGVILSIILVFRTNSAYDRWWEGRKQWGALVNNCRNLALHIRATFPENSMEERKFLAIRISNFCIAFKEHLRKGVQLDELIHLEDEDRKVYSQIDHLPNYISYEIQKSITQEFRKGSFSEAELINIKPHQAALLDILGACERIKKTPIPFSYAVFIKIFILIYGALLPFALMPEFGFWTVPIVMLVFFAFIGIELMAEEIEDPFGLDCNDLPTGTIAHTIKNNVFEILVDKHPTEKTSQNNYDKIF